MLESSTMRNDIKIGEVALRMAVDSFGREGAPNAASVRDRANIFYSWLLTERKG